MSTLSKASAKAEAQVDHEEEEDRIERTSSKSSHRIERTSSKSSQGHVRRSSERSQGHVRHSSSRSSKIFREKRQEPEKTESEDDEFNQIIDPEVEERVLVLTESVDDLRAELLEFKRTSTIERERLEFEVRQAKEELQRVKMAPLPKDNVEPKNESVLVHIATMFSDQFDEQGYMKCLL